MKDYLNILRKACLASILITMGVLATVAQERSVRQVFVEAPTEILPSLGDVERANILAAYDATTKGKTPTEPSRNILGGDVAVLQLTDSYIQMTLDSYTELQLKLLPYKRGKDYVTAMVVTSLTTPKQSVVVFYDASWGRIEPNEFLRLPNPEDYFQNPEDVQKRAVKKALVERGRLSYQITFDANRPECIIKVTTFDDELAKELHPEVAPLLKEYGVRYEWRKSGGFRKR